MRERLERLFSATAVLAGVGALAMTGVASAETGSAAAKQITPSGVGQVKLGKTYRELRAARLVGRIRPGCPLAGANQRSARLRGPLKGSVDLTQRSPRRVANISITGGATARGIRIGATSGAVRTAFPKATFDRSTEETFGITLAKIPKSGGGRLQFALDSNTDKVEIIGLPFIPFCE